MPSITMWPCKEMLLIMTTCNWLSSCDHLPLSPLNAKKAAQPPSLSPSFLFFDLSHFHPTPNFLRINNQTADLSPLPRFSSLLLVSYLFLSQLPLFFPATSFLRFLSSF